MASVFESLRSRRDPYGSANPPDLRGSPQPQGVPPPSPMDIINLLRARQMQQDNPPRPPSEIPSYGGTRGDLPPSLNAPAPRTAHLPELPPGWSYVEG